MKIGRRKKWLGGLVLLIPLVWEALITRKPYAVPDSFGFYAWFGFVSCVMLVLAALLIGRVLKRRDDYYDD